MARQSRRQIRCQSSEHFEPLQVPGLEIPTNLNHPVGKDVRPGSGATSRCHEGWPVSPASRAL